MNANNRKPKRTSALTAIAILTAAPALLFVGAGTANAGADPIANGNGDVAVIYGGGGLAVFATILDHNNPPGVTEVCHYHSVGTGNTPRIPFNASTLVTGDVPSAPIFIPGLELGGTWDVTVTCKGTGSSANFQERY